MKVFNRIKNGWKGLRAGFQSIDDIDKLMAMAIGGTPTNTGVPVNEKTAMQFSAWFSGIQQISGTIASLPLVVYKRTGENTKEKYTAHPLTHVLGVKTNVRTQPFIWKEISQENLLVWGNSYSYIERDNYGRVIGLWLMSPSRMKTIEIMPDGTLKYHYKTTDNKVVPYSHENILHIPGLGYDGIKGMSVLKCAQESIGLGLAYEVFQAKFLGQGTNAGGLLKSSKTLSKDAKKNLKESFNKAYSGLGNSHKVILLEEGVEFDNLTMPLEDAQFLQSREFSVQEIARWLNMPPHKLKDLSHATYSNIEQEQSAYYQDTIRPWLERQESVMGPQLLFDAELDKVFIEYDFNAILRADIKTRYEAYDIARRNGVMNANQWRGKENMNPIPSEYGEAYILPMNMMNAETITEPVELKSTEPIDPEPEEDKDPDKTVDNPEDKKKEEKSFIYADMEKRLMKENRLDSGKASAIVARRRTTESYRNYYLRIFTGIVSKEVSEVKRLLKQDPIKDIFKDNIQRFYAEYEKYIIKRYDPVLYSFASEIIDGTYNEIDQEKGGAYLDSTITKYAAVTAQRYVISSKGQLGKITRESTVEEFEKNIEARLNKWTETKPEQISRRELIDGENAFTQAVYFSVGMSSTWVAVGKSCPYCNMLDGRTVSQGIFYVSKGGALSPEGKEPMKMGSNLAHPSAHSGCDCAIIGG